MSHLIVISEDQKKASEAGQNILLLSPMKYRRRLCPRMTVNTLSRMPEIKYFRLVLFDNCENEKQIAQLYRDISLFIDQTETKIIFTINKSCPSLAKDDRFKIIEL